MMKAKNKLHQCKQDIRQNKIVLTSLKIELKTNKQITLQRKK